ncbi:hypothetical protein [Varunaivibrio sulfuroxidans]|uniref:Radical SAM protein with 4Fe4S-binding SPASM domain n=1 Tax=Varunaivibrio sulfuroxidans TaxID=1773489 RepID=A0A4R3J5H2_9PROT|nr:hypothetical protein [Varunaivibrio sulfuroxidans]TCS60565.1 radical SAM protein with 4Fe4S-binding SPASM domain [Varunaivibrio sulfuroxidans]WES30055.1 hypothetical protein P3M64_10455 [Varunaivibrio sulfuroxidans]
MPLPHFTHKGRIFLTDEFGYLYLPFHGMIVALPYDEAVFLKRCETQTPDALIKSGEYDETDAQIFTEYLARIQKEKNCFNYKYDEKYYIKDFQNIDIIFNFVLDCDGVYALSDDARQFLHDIILTHAYKANAVHFTLLGGDAAGQAEVRDALDLLSARLEKQFIYSSTQEELRQQETHIIAQNDTAQARDDEAAPYDLLERFLTWLHIGTVDAPLDIPHDLGERLAAALPAFMDAAAHSPRRFKRLLRAVLQFAQNRKRFFNCAAGINSVYCDLAHGGVHGCKKDPARIGTLSEGLHDATRKAYFRGSVIHKDKCLACWCRYFCAAGCRLNAAPPDCTAIRAVYEQIGQLNFKLQETNRKILTSSLRNEIQSYHECLFTLYHDSCVMDKVPERLGEQP